MGSSSLAEGFLAAMACSLSAQRGASGCLARRLDHVDLDAVTLAAKQGDALAALVVDLDVVDAGAPADRALLRCRGQHVAHAGRGEKINRAAVRHRRQVVAVAGISEGAVR